MKAEIDRFDKRAEEIIAAFASTLDSRQTPPDLYHYTNDIGLKGILESGHL
jgi:hypothetical protein